MAAALVLLGLVAVSQATLHYPNEGHLSNVRQLTFGGQNAEGYFSFDDKFLTLQATGKDHYGTGCDQIYRLDLTQPAENQTLHRLSTGLGSCTCSYFYPDNSHVLYAGNFHKIRVNASAGSSDDSCPEKVCQSQRAKTDPVLADLCNTSYTWDINPDYDIFKVNQYGNVVAQLTDSPGYDAEGVMSPDGKYIAFTSIRSGDLELWIMNADGTNPRQITNELGYDGGSFFSPDGKRLIFRASRPKTPEEIQKYKDLLSYNLVAPTAMELFVVNVDGTKMRQITHLGGANWAPYYHKNNRQVIFSSDYASTAGFGAFDLYLINDDGSGLERVTYDNGQFDSFPMFSYSGKQLVWGSSRNGNGPYDLNLFIADWIDTPANNTTKAEEKETRAELRSNRVSDAIRRVEQEKEQEEQREKEEIPWMNKQTEPFDGTLHYPNEVHLSNVKQLTFGGANAEGYFSFDNKRLTIQATGKDNYGTGCDQIYQIDLTKDPATTPMRRLSSGLGATTCSYFFKENDDDHILYAGDFLKISLNQSDWSNTCPGKTCQSERVKTDPKLANLCNTSYTWDIYPNFDIVKVNKYGNIVQQLTWEAGYDAEGVVSPDGKSIAFTSMRSGDLELWIMDSDGKNPRQITNELGYDGGSFFSPDGKRLIFRASRPKTPEEIQKYKDLLSYNLVAPTEMELFVVDVDGKNMRQITHLGAANWAPYYLNDNKRVIFSSDHASTAGFGAFDLYLINDDGTGLERVTWDNGQFDSFPMMSYDGKKLVWGSSRNGKTPYDLNLFIADWVDPAPNNASTTVAPTTTPTVAPTTTPTVAPTTTPTVAPTTTTGASLVSAALAFAAAALLAL